MATPPLTPQGATPGNAPQPPPGSSSRLASNLAAKHGATGAAPSKVAAQGAPSSRGRGRIPIENEVSNYCEANGFRLVSINSTLDQGGFQADPVGHVVTPEFVQEVTENLLKGVEAFRVRQVALRVKTLCGDAGLAKEFAESAAAPPGCIETVSKGMGEVARKYPTMLQWAPELAILGALGTWFAKDRSTDSKVLELEERIKKQAVELARPKQAEKPSNPNEKP